MGAGNVKGRRYTGVQVLRLEHTHTHTLERIDTTNSFKRTALDAPINCSQRCVTLGFTPFRIDLGQPQQTTLS